MTETLILCRGFEHISQYLQCAGRAARPHGDKQEYRLLDLTGASYRYDFPDVDREYSLEGTGIFEPREGRWLGESETTGVVLGLPLIEAEHTAYQPPTAEERTARWEELKRDAREGEITLLEARLRYQEEFGRLAPIFVD